MATVGATILKGDKKADGTWNVKIRVWHNNKPAYIDTVHFVVLKQLGKKSKESETLVIKDRFVLDSIEPDLIKYRKWITANSNEVKSMTAQHLRDALENSDKPQVTEVLKPVIDFVAFANELFVKMKEIGKESSTKPLVTVVNSLKDYFKSDIIDIEQIDYSFLVAYEEYLTNPRRIIRYNGGKEEHDKIVPGLNKLGLHNHMRDLRGLFNKARKKFNNNSEKIIKITHYPFEEYKVGKAPRTAKKTRPIEEIIAVRDCVLPAGSRAEMARDLAMLSFYMLGMNAADMFELPPPDQIKKRYGYERSKTRDRRDDRAFISIKVVPEARIILDKYAGTLQKRYTSEAGLNKALDIGLDSVSLVTGIPGIGFYDLRHCVGDWARNKLRYSRDFVAEVLNHTDDQTVVTDIYISKDWSVIDEIQAGLIKLLNPVDSEG